MGNFKTSQLKSHVLAASSRIPTEPRPMRCTTPALHYTRLALHPPCTTPALRYTRLALHPPCTTPALRYTRLAPHPKPNDEAQGGKYEHNHQPHRGKLNQTWAENGVNILATRLPSDSDSGSRRLRLKQGHQDACFRAC